MKSTAALWGSGSALPVWIFNLLLFFGTWTVSTAQLVNDGDTLILDNSTNIVAGDLVIGTNGTGTLLRLQNGAVLSNLLNATIGLNPGADSNRVELLGSGDQWWVGNLLTVGSNGSFCQLVISNGAEVVAPGVVTGFESTAVNSDITVTDPSSKLLAPIGIRIGFQAHNCRLTVSNGAQVSAQMLRIGGVGPFQIPVTNSVAIVTGPGTEVSCSIVRTESVSSRIVVENTATLRVEDSGKALLRVNAGSVVLNSGTIHADGLDAAGIFEFKAGTLNVNTSRVSSGQVFFVGDWQSAATLNLVSGGSHRFQGGLVITTNATLAGSGLVWGLGSSSTQTTNYGTIAPGNPIGSLVISNQSVLQPSSMLAFDIAGTTPTNRHDVLSAKFLVRLDGSLTLSLLRSFHPSSNDTFTLMTFPSVTGAFANFTSGQRLTTTDGLGSFVVTVSATNVVASDYQSPDTNGNGLTDYAEYLASLDSDADGQSDWAEHLAGTDPLNPDSTLRILSVTPEAAGFRVQFQSVPGKDYLIHWSDDLSLWNILTNPTLTTPFPNLSEWLDDGSESGSAPSTNRAYKVGIGLP